MNLPKLKSQNNRWPDGAIVYQIYPRSFYDSNGDGIGDIPGITAKLDYLKNLGVNAIWISPFYKSPMADFGYDVADYCSVDPIFGEIADMDKLIEKTHSKGIKVLIDLVPNHSSDEHPWFIESKKSRNNKYSDWYIWRDASGKDKKGYPKVPNNWLDIFTGETAWEWVPARQQFYLHSFDVKQPDLNWENQEVREAIKNAMRFWLDKGIDGFRVDAVNHMGKDPEFKDNPKNPFYVPGVGSNFGSLDHIYSKDWPNHYDYLAEMAAVLKEPQYQNSPRFMVTEAYPVTQEPIREYLNYYKNVDPLVSAPFNFHGLIMSWEADSWRGFLDEFHTTLDNFNELCAASYAFGNHDKPRLATRLGDQAARSAAVLLLTLPGMAFVYNGEELGMKNGKIPKSLVKDPAAKSGEGRDPQRTPLQWSTGKNAGFTTADQPWLPVNDDYKENNIQVERKDPSSYLSLYQTLCKLRNTSTAIKTGRFKTIHTGHESVLGYTRSNGKKSHIILVNFSEQQVEAKLPATIKVGRMQISSDYETKHKKIKHGVVRLLPNEAVVLAGK